MPCPHRYEFIIPETNGLHLELPDETRRSIAMTMPLPTEPPENDGLKLERISDEAGWSRMAEMRVEVEEAFGVEPARARRMVDHIRHRKCFLDGEWYLAHSGEDNLVGGVGGVGGVGLVVFENADSGRVGRLQDVDILPKFQGRGFGNELMSAVTREARHRFGCSSICLRADAADWPRHWYARLGFTAVGEWLHFFDAPNNS